MTLRTMETTDAIVLLLIALPMLVIWAFVVVDVLRRSDLGAGARIAWILGALLLPLLTIAVYLIVRPRAVQAAGGSAPQPPASSTPSDPGPVVQP
jgi:hypothetical protein